MAGQMIGGPQLEASETLAPRTSSPETVQTASATWYVQYQANDVFFRCTAPAEAVGGKVQKLYEKTLDRATSYPNTDTGLPWRAEFRMPDGETVVARTKKDWVRLTRSKLQFEGMDVTFPKHEGTAVWIRPDARRAILAGFMREQGILTVAETDDNYFADPKLNLHQRQVGWNDDAIENICRAMASFDRNVFSTPWLRDRYWKEYKRRLTEREANGRRFRRAPLPEPFVCRNHVPRSDWPERVESDGPIRVGFMGSGSHVWDVQNAYKAIHAAKTYWGATTTMIGYNPAAPDKEPDELNINGTVHQMRSEKSKRFRDGWAKVVDTHIPWIDPGVYRRAPLPLDIGLAPLVGDNDFTMGKSDAKALEYTISGAACVLWRSGIYTSAGWKDGENCLLAGSADEMAECVRLLIHDPKMRYELVTAAQDMVWNTRNEDNLRQEWSEALCL